MRRNVAVATIMLLAASWLSGQDAVEWAGSPDAVRFAVIGDNGTGGQAQYEIGRQMAIAHGRFPFDFVLMLGDNMYGRQQPQDFTDKFERPYAALLTAGVTFFATLGNHDDQGNRFYQPFHMGNERYYTFTKGDVVFFVFDTNLMDRAQIEWIEQVLSASRQPWKVCVFHHPLYSNARRHGSNVELRVLLEPLLVQAGITVVFSGHDHVYERLKPQKGITYFVEGASGQLRRGDIQPSQNTAAAYDDDQSFMLVEIAGTQMRFQTISRTGRVVDSGAIARRSTS
jgi:predicted MPP superfamily phosphohydrolase